MDNILEHSKMFEDLLYIIYSIRLQAMLTKVQPFSDMNTFDTIHMQIFCLISILDREPENVS